jgi:acetyl esterase
VFSSLIRLVSRRSFGILALSLALPWPAAKAQPEGAPAAVPQKSPTAAVTPPPTFADVRYGPDRRNVLDFWKADTGKPAPVLIYIHGGGIVHGDKSLIPGVDIEFYRRAGISVASIDYRYSTQAPYPAPMLDSARAVQFIRSKAAEWNLDPKRVGAYGNSAGAGIALWLAFHADLAKPDSADPISRQSTRLLCAGSQAGQSSYNPFQIREWIGGRAWEASLLVQLYGLKSAADFEKPENLAQFEDASPITHLTRDAPPIVMIYTEPDEPLRAGARPGEGFHHPRFGRFLKEKMDALGIECVFRNTTDSQQPHPNIVFREFLRNHLLAKPAN